MSVTTADRRVEVTELFILADDLFITAERAEPGAAGPDAAAQHQLVNTNK